jgi:hypothetical protein
VHEHDFARADACDVLEQQRSGGERAAGGCGPGEIDGAGHLGDERRRCQGDLSQTAPADECGDARAWCGLLDARPERSDRSGDLQARDERPFRGVPGVAASRHDVDEVDAGAGDLDRDLPRAGLGRGQLGDPRGARVRGRPVEHDRAHHPACLPVSARREMRCPRLVC